MSTNPLVNYATKDGKQVVIEECCVCGETHRHGAAGFSPDDPVSERAPHCDVPLGEAPSEYMIIVQGGWDE